MKYSKIVEALDRIFYLSGKQRISYRGTQQTAANSDTLRIPRNFLAIVPEVTHCYLLLYKYFFFTITKRCLLYESNKSK